MWLCGPCWPCCARLCSTVSCRVVARGVPRAHLGRGIALSRALRMRVVEHGSIVRRGGGGGRSGGERHALRDPIALTIVEPSEVVKNGPNCDVEEPAGHDWQPRPTLKRWEATQSDANGI